MHLSRIVTSGGICKNGCVCVCSYGEQQFESQLEDVPIFSPRSLLEDTCEKGCVYVCVCWGVGVYEIKIKR